MKCPCCETEMKNVSSHDSDEHEIELRIHEVYICFSPNEICNGLIIRKAIEDNQLTFITPRHTCTTLHGEYVKATEKEIILKRILSAFEWDIYSKIINPPITQFQMWIMKDNGTPKFLGYSSGKDFKEALTNAHITNSIIGDMDYIFYPEKIMVRDLQMRYYDLYPSKADLLACNPIMEESTG